MSTELKAGERVIYVDAKSVEHNALVTGLNAFNPGFLSLVYVDANGELVTKMDVVDIDHAPIEANPELPTYHLNCWKSEYDVHNAPATDHPMFDHPFAPKPTDEDGRPIPASRPEYEAQVAHHQTIHVPIPAGDHNPEVKVLQGTAGVPAPGSDEANAAAGVLHQNGPNE